MGAWGGIITGFFGGVFAAITLALRFGWTGPSLGLPFIASAAIALAAVVTLRRPGPAILRSRQAGRVIMYSTIGEGIGLLLATNLVINLGHPELLLPVVALVVGLHFLPMAHGMPFRPFYVLGTILVALAAIGFVLSRTSGGVASGFGSAVVLWAAALLAVRREMKAKNAWHPRPAVPERTPSSAPAWPSNRDRLPGPGAVHPAAGVRDGLPAGADSTGPDTSLDKESRGEPTGQTKANPGRPQELPS